MNKCHWMTDGAVSQKTTVETGNNKKMGHYKYN